METLILYGVAFFFALVALGAGIGVYLTRTESHPPVDPTSLLNAIDEAVVVVDPDETVVIANLTFRSLFGANATGAELETVLESVPELYAATQTEDNSPITLAVNGETRHVEVCSFPLGEGIHEDRKRVVLFHDVSEHIEREQALEAQNEQLAQFASIISHDLRNPLDVAIGRTNAVRTQLDDPELVAHLDTAHEAHHRIQHIITDVLALARNGNDVEPVALSLEAVATTAWNHVETNEATLSVTTERTIRADEPSLCRLFENLFRNAIEHGGADVTVRVGDTADGFFVADDGTGLPVDKPLFEPGYTVNETGTGLGLAIVKDIADAHNWTVETAVDAAGGARFEFSGVDHVTQTQERP